MEAYSRVCGLLASNAALAEITAALEDAGDARSLYWAGALRVKQGDTDSGLSLLRAAADRGNPGANMLLGAFSEAGEHMPLRLSAACAYYRAAFDAGWEEGALRYAACARRVRSVTHNEAKARALLEQCGSPEAKHSLAELLIEASVDKRRAGQLLEEAAASGYPPAMLRLYRRLPGAAGGEHLRKAVEAGYPPALQEAGQRALGEGDCRGAAELWEAAANQGYLPSLYSLGEALYHQDKSRATGYLREAERRGFALARQFLQWKE